MSEENLEKVLYRNRGLLPPQENSREYVAGGVSGVVYENRNILGNWLDFLPTDERQKYRYFDTFGCASFSCLNSCETQFLFLIFSKLIRNEDVEWLRNPTFADGSPSHLSYLDANGKVNFDDRWLVVLSGTKPGVGNYMNAPWDAARKYGLVPHGSVPFRENMTQKEYYDKSDFPRAAYDLGQEFLKRFLIQYERISPPNDGEFTRNIHHAPLCIGVPTCDGWDGAAIINYCNWNANHASLLVFMGDDILKYKFDYDTYPIFLKKLVKNYKIDFAYKGVVSPVVSVGGEVKERFIFTKNLKYGDSDNDVTQLCRRLIEEDCLESWFPPKPLYDVNVAKGVRTYQNKNKIISFWEDIWYRGKYFGPRTRLFINNNPVKYPW